MSTSGKYLKLLDAETLAYIDKVNACYPDDAVDASIEQQRKFYNAMCQSFDIPRPDSITSSDKTLKASSGEHTIALRHYEPADKHGKTVVIYVHGGGFVVGDLDSHDSVCTELCQRTGLTVVAVDYRLSPEYKHPAALLDTLDVINHSAQPDQRLILCGDSAGANLIAASLHALRDGATDQSNVDESAGEKSTDNKTVITLPASRMRQKEILKAIAGQVLIYPGLGGNRFQGSYVEHEFAPQLTVADLVFYTQVRLPEQLAPVANALATQQTIKSLQLSLEQTLWLQSMGPLHDSDFSGLPPTVAFAAQCDPLHDDGLQYCQRITQAGGTAKAFSETGLVHGYLRARHSVERARLSFSRIVEAITQLDNGLFYGESI